MSNILKNKKKVSIIGKGTGGCLTTSILLRNKNIDIDWYFDPNISAQSVGEGTLPHFPEHLQEDWGLSYNELPNLDYSVKTGIRKINWGGDGDFIHTFDLGEVGIHFNASKYQSLITKLAPHKGVNIIPTPIQNLKDIDSDYIIDCSGSPKNYSKYNTCNFIPVNSAYITQCYWDKPEFNYTLTIARPYGWVFGIPLQNRCSIGYLFNKDINSLDEVKEDVQNIFSQFNLTPSEDKKYLNFNNYYKKQNFTDTISYNGNASFFLEPMEATSLTFTTHSALLTSAILNKEISIEECNESFLGLAEETEGMIMLHYLAGSKFNTKFWEFAKEKANICLEQQLKNSKFKNTIVNSFKLKDYPFDVKAYNKDELSYGAWSTYSYYQNLKSLDLYKKILPYIK